MVMPMRRRQALALVVLALVAATAVLIARGRRTTVGARSGAPEITAAVQEETGLPAQPNDSAESVTGTPTRAPVTASPEAPDEGRAELVVRVVLAGSSSPLGGVRVGFQHAEEPEGVMASEEWIEAFVQRERELWQEFDAPNETMETDALGIVVLSVPARKAFGVETLCDDPALEDALLEVEPLDVDERREVTLEVGQGGAVFLGRVVERGTEEPVPGAEVQLLEPLGTDVLASTRTDAIGTFSFRVGSFEDEQLLQIEARGFGIAFGELGKGHERPGSEAIFRLRRSASLFGRIVSLGGTPVPGSVAFARVKRPPLRQPALDPRLSFDEEVITWSVAADASGAYRIDGLPASVRLGAGAMTEDSGSSSDLMQLSLQEGEARELDFVLEDDPVIDGEVVDEEGRPVPGLELWLMRHPRCGDTTGGVVFFDSNDEPELELVTDAAGRFQIGSIPRGAWLLGPAPGESQIWVGSSRLDRPAKKREFPGLGQRVTITAGHQDLTLVVECGLAIEGGVVDAEGLPLEDITIACKSVDIGRAPRARSGQDGTFCTDPLPRGEFVLTALGDVEHHRSPEIRARAGERNVVFALQDRVACRVEGIVLGFDGPERVHVRARPRAHPHWVSGVGSDPDGRFVLASMDEGIYDFTAESVDGRLGFVPGVEVRTGEKPSSVRIELRPAARLVVRYESEEPTAGIEIFQDRNMVDWSVAVEGASGSIVVPAGELEVRLFPGIGLTNHADWGDTPVVRSVTTVAGAESEVIFP
jgi:hypothetical protein